MDDGLQLVDYCIGCNKMHGCVFGVFWRFGENPSLRKAIAAAVR